MTLNFSDQPTLDFQFSDEPEDLETGSSGFSFTDHPIEERPTGIETYQGMANLIPTAGRGLAEGITTELPQQLGKLARFVGGVSSTSPVLSAPRQKAGKALEDLGKSVQEYFEKKATEWYGPEAERAPKDEAGRIVYEGSKMMGPSLIPAVSMTKGLQVLGGLTKLVRASNAAQKAGKTELAMELMAKANEVAATATNLAAASTAGIFGGAQAQDTLDTAEQLAKVLELTGHPGDAQKIRDRAPGTALATGAIEALGEFFGTKYLAKMLRIDEAQVVQRGIGRCVKDLLKSVGVEVGTEIGQAAGQAGVELATGVRPTADPYKEAKDVIGPTIFLSLATMGIGGVHAKLTGTGKIPMDKDSYAEYKELEANPLITEEELKAYRDTYKQTGEAPAKAPTGDLFGGFRDEPGADSAQQAVDNAQEAVAAGKEVPLSYGGLVPQEQRAVGEDIRKAEEEAERNREVGLRQELHQVAESNRFNTGMGLQAKKQIEVQAQENTQAAVETQRKTDERNAAEAQARAAEAARVKAQKEAEVAATKASEAQAAMQEFTRFREAIQTNEGLVSEGTALLSPYESQGTSEQKGVAKVVRQLHKALSVGEQNPDSLKKMQYDVLQVVNQAGLVNPKFVPFIQRLVHKADNMITAINLEKIRVERANAKAKETAAKTAEGGKKAPKQAQAEKPQAVEGIGLPKSPEAILGQSGKPSAIMDRALKLTTGEIVTGMNTVGKPIGLHAELYDALPEEKQKLVDREGDGFIMDTGEYLTRKEAVKILEDREMATKVAAVPAETEFDLKNPEHQKFVKALGYSDRDITIGSNYAGRGKQLLEKVKAHGKDSIAEHEAGKPADTITLGQLKELTEKETALKAKTTAEAKGLNFDFTDEANVEALKKLGYSDIQIETGKRLAHQPKSTRPKKGHRMGELAEPTKEVPGAISLEEHEKALQAKKDAEVKSKEAVKEVKTAKAETKKAKLQALKEKQMTLFARGEGAPLVPDDQLEAHLQTLKAGFQKARINLAKVVTIHLLPRSQDLKTVNHPLYMELLEEKMHDRVMAVYDSKTNSIYVFANTNPTVIEAKRSAWHEMGHMSLWDLVGKSDIDPLMDRVRSKYSDLVQDFLTKYDLMDTKDNRRVAAEEVLIEKFVKHEDITILDKLRSVIQKFTRHIGFSDAITESDVKALLNAMRVNLIENKRTDLDLRSIRASVDEGGKTPMGRYLRAVYPKTWEVELVKKVQQVRDGVADGSIDEGSPKYKKLFEQLGSYLQGRTIRHLPGSRFLVGAKTLYGSPKATDRKVVSLRQGLYGVLEVTEYFDQHGNQVIPGPIFPEDPVERGKMIDEIAKKHQTDALWYQEWNDWMRQFEKAGIPAETITKYIKIQAVLSAGQGPATNQRIFARAINALEAGTLVSGKRPPRANPQFSLFSKAENKAEPEPEGSGISAQDHVKIMEIWEGRDKYNTLEERQKAYGMKVGAYMTAGLFPKHKGAVVIDRHMPRPWGYSVTWSPYLFDGKIAFDIHPEIQAQITKDIQESAKRTGLTPAGIQAAIWFEVRLPDLGAASYWEAAQASKEYLPDSMNELLTVEGQHAIHYSDQTLKVIRGSKLKEDHHSYSRRDVGKRKEMSTAEWPYIPLGQFYAPGAKPEPSLRSKVPHLAEIPVGTVYDGATDLLKLWNKAGRIVDKNPNAHVVNIFAKLVRDLKYKGFSHETASGDVWLALFGETKVQQPVSIKASLSEDLNVNDVPQNLAELDVVAEDRTGKLQDEMMEALKIRYPEVRMEVAGRSLAELGPVTGHKMEYGMSVTINGPLPSIKAALSDVIGLGKKQGSVLIRGSAEVLGKPNNGVTIQFKLRKELTLSEIEAGLKAAGVKEYNLIPREGQEILFDLFVDKKPPAALKKFYQEFGVPETAVMFGDTAEFIDKAMYESHITKHFGAKEGAKVYEKARATGEHYALTGGNRVFTSGVRARRIEPTGSEVPGRGEVQPLTPTKVTFIPVSEADAQKVIRRVTSVLHNIPNIVLFETPMDVPENWRRLWPLTEKDDLTGVQGFVHGKWERGDAIIGIIRTSQKSEADLLDTLFHEMLGHWGIRQVYPDKFEVEDFFVKVFDSHVATKKDYLDKLLKAYRFDITSRADQARIAEEWFARQIARPKHLRESWVREKYDQLTILYQKFARALGFKTPLSDAEIRQAIRESAASILKPGSNLMDLIGERPTKQMIREREMMATPAPHRFRRVEEKKVREARMVAEQRVYEEIRKLYPPPVDKAEVPAWRDKLSALHDAAYEKIGRYRMFDVAKAGVKKVNRAKREGPESTSWDKISTEEIAANEILEIIEDASTNTNSQRLLRTKPREYAETVERVADMYEDAVKEIVTDFRKNPDAPQSWPVAPAGAVIRLWNEYGDTGYLSDRSAKAMDKIWYRVAQNICRLTANTDLMGMGPIGNRFWRNLLEPLFGIENFKTLSGFESHIRTDMEDEVYSSEPEALRTSDYGIHLNDAVPLLMAKTPEEKLVEVDKVFNRVHDRYDLSQNFIEGGRDTLDKLAGKESQLTEAERSKMERKGTLPPSFRVDAEEKRKQSDYQRRAYKEAAEKEEEDYDPDQAVQDLRVALADVPEETEKELNQIRAKFASWGLAVRARYTPAEVRQHIGVQAVTGKAMQPLGLSNWQKFVTQIFDTQLPRKVLEMAMNPNLPAEMSGYKSTTMMSNLPSIMHSIFYEGRPKFEGNWIVTRPEQQGGLFNIYQKLDKTAEDFFLWQLAKSAQEMRNKGREHLFGMDKNNPGEYLDDQEMIDSILDMVQPTLKANQATWTDAELRLREINTAILDFAEHAGIINAEDRAEWERYNYIPFNRVLPEEDPLMEGLQQLFPKNPKAFVGTVFELEGGKMNVGDPLVNLANTYTYLVNQSLKNLANVKTLGLAQAAGLLEPSFPTPGKVKPGEISIRVDGAAKYFKVLDPMLWDALVEVDNMSKGALTGWAKKVLNWPKLALTYGVTVAPAFRFANFIRDTLNTSFMQRSFVGIFRSMKGFYGALVRSPEFKEFASTGGAFSGAYHSRDVFGKNATAEDILKIKANIVGPIQGTGLALFNPLPYLKFANEIWQRIGEASENANRLRTYHKLRQEGKSAFEAGYEAKDLLDFHRSGKSAILRVMTQTVPFLNARLQGLYKAGRASVDEKTRMNFWLHGMALMVASMLLHLHNRDDDRYKSLTDAEKLMYWHFFDVPGIGHLRIPTPFELGIIFASLPAAIAERFEGTRTTSDLFRFMQRAVVNVLAFNPVPQAFQPIFTQIANKDPFTGVPVIPSGEEKLAPAEQYGPKTNKTARFIGEKMNVSPRRIDKLVQDYFSYAGLIVFEYVDLLLTNRFVLYPEDPQDRLSDRWVTGIGRFARGTSPAEYIKEQEIFYDYLNESETAFSTWRHHLRLRDRDAAKKWRSANRDILAVRATLTSAQEQINRINHKIKLIYASEKFTRSEKRDQIDILLQKRGDIFKKAIRKYDFRLEQRGKRNADTDTD